MPRLIDADALKASLIHDYAYAAAEMVDKATTIEAESVKHGRWIVGGSCNHVPHRIKNPEKWVIYKCSECGYSNGRKQSNYCPNCGAKMEGGEADA